MNTCLLFTPIGQLLTFNYIYLLSLSHSWLKHFKVTCRHSAVSSPSDPKNEDIFPHEHDTIVTLKKFISIWIFVTQLVKTLPAMQETLVQFLAWEDPLEKEMATHSSILAWRIPWTEEPGGLQSMEWKVRQDLVTERLPCNIWSIFK